MNWFIIFCIKRYKCRVPTRGTLEDCILGPFQNDSLFSAFVHPNPFAIFGLWANEILKKGIFQYKLIGTLRWWNPPPTFSAVMLGESIHFLGRLLLIFEHCNKWILVHNIWNNVYKKVHIYLITRDLPYSDISSERSSLSSQIIDLSCFPKIGQNREKTG